MAAPDPCYIPPLPPEGFANLAAAGLPLVANAKVPNNIEFHLVLMRMLREIQMCVGANSTYPRCNIPIRTTGGLCVGTVPVGGITATQLTDTDADFSTPRRCGTDVLLTNCFIVIYAKDDPCFICRASITASTTTTITFAEVDWVGRGQITAITDLEGMKYVIYANGDLDQYDRWPDCPNSWEYIAHDTGQVTSHNKKIYQAGAFAYFPTAKLATTPPAVGTYTISVTAGMATDTTGALAANASPGEIQTALMALGNVGSGKAFAFALYDGSVGLAFDKTLAGVSVSVTPTFSTGNITATSISNLLVDLFQLWATSDWLHPKTSYPDKPNAFDLVIYDSGSGGDNKVHRFSITTVPGRGTLGVSFGGFAPSQGALYSIIKQGKVWSPGKTGVIRKAWYRGLFADNGLTHMPDDSIGIGSQLANEIVFNTCDGDCEESDCLTPIVNILDVDIWNDCCSSSCCSTADFCFTPNITKTIRWVQTQLMKVGGPWIMPGYAGGASAPHQWNFPEAMAIASAAEVAAGRPALSAFVTSISSISSSGRQYIGAPFPYDGIILYWTMLDDTGNTFTTGRITQLQKDMVGVYMTEAGIGPDQIGWTMKCTFGFTRHYDLEFKYDAAKTNFVPSELVDEDGNVTAVDPPGIADSDTPATAGTPTLSSGTITAIAVTDGGEDYVSPPMVVITGNGHGAIAKATISAGAVTGVTMIEGGTGYTTASAVFKGGGELSIGIWLTKPASTVYCRFENGTTSESGVPFTPGDLATLRRDNSSDPTLPSFSPTDPSPLLPYRDYQFSGKCGLTPPNLAYKDKETDRPGGGAVLSAGKTGGVVTQLTIAEAVDFHSYWYTTGSNTLITFSGTVSSGTGTTFTGTLSANGVEYGAMATSPWLNWTSWATGLTVTVSRTISMVTTVYKTLTVGADIATGIVTVLGLDGFSFIGGDTWQITVPRYELDRYQTHRAKIIKASGNVVVNIIANDANTLFIDPADMLAISSGDLAAGVKVNVITFEGGSVLRRAASNSFWEIPVGVDPRTDPHTGKKPRYKRKPQSNLPFNFKAYGPIAPFDLWGPWLFNEIKALNDTIINFLGNFGWDNKPSHAGSPENSLRDGHVESARDSSGCSTGGFASAMDALTAAFAADTGSPGSGGPFVDGTDFAQPSCCDCVVTTCDCIDGNCVSSGGPCVASHELAASVQYAYPVANPATCFIGASVAFYAFSPALADIDYDVTDFCTGACEGEGLGCAGPTDLTIVTVHGIDRWAGGSAGLSYNAWAGIGGATIGSDGYAYGPKVGGTPVLKSLNAAPGIPSGYSNSMDTSFTISAAVAIVSPARVYL